MSRHRYVVHIVYADGSPGMSFEHTVRDAVAVAGAAMHGGRAIAAAEVCEHLATGQDVPTSHRYGKRA